jgi:DUF1009 family protein
MTESRKLGIIAGRGELPRRLALACVDRGSGYFIIALRGHCEQVAVDGLDHAWVELGAIGATLKHLNAESCRDVVMAGPISRPSFSSMQLDWRGALLLPKLLTAKGDDAVLSILVGEFEKEGFGVVGIDDVLGDLKPPTGALGQHRPDDRQRADIARGVEVARALGGLDVGQAVVVQQGFVLGVEAAEGTDALLGRCRSLHREGPGGVLVKIAKPAQERRTDLPTIGADTVAAAAAAGLAGIAVEAGGSLIIDRQAVVDAADAQGLFIIGIDPDDF